MRKSSTGKNKRSFTLVGAQKTDGCHTTFRHGRKSMTYISSNPEGAAKKALTKLCKKKKTKGTCTLVLSVKETTLNSKGKVYTYKVRREKAEQEGPFGNMFVNKSKSVKTKKAKKCSSKKSKKRKM